MQSRRFRPKPIEFQEIEFKEEKTKKEEGAQVTQVIGVISSIAWGIGLLIVLLSL